MCFFPERRMNVYHFACIYGEVPRTRPKKKAAADFIGHGLEERKQAKPAVLGTRKEKTKNAINSPPAGM